MQSNVKNSYLLQLFIASRLSGVFMCFCKKAAAKQLKKKSLSLILMILLNHTFKSKTSLKLLRLVKRK